MFNRKQRQIEDLEFKLKIAEEKSACMLKLMRKRLRRAGSSEYTYLDCPDVKTLVVELEPETYGQYVLLDKGCMSDDVIEAAEDRLAVAIAKGLIRNELIQFIVKDKNWPDPLDQYGTIAAKIRVVPWEQMTKTIKIDLTNQPFSMPDPDK